MKVGRRVADGEPDDRQGAGDHGEHGHESGEGKGERVVGGLALAVSSQDARGHRLLRALDERLTPSPE